MWIQSGALEQLHLSALHVLYLLAPFGLSTLHWIDIRVIQRTVFLSKFLQF